MEIFPRESEDHDSGAESERSYQVEPTSKGQNQALKAGLALMLVAIVALLAVVAFIVWRDSRAPANPITRPAPSSRSTAHPTPRAEPAPQPAPPVQVPSAPTEQYVKTPWGTRCQVTTNEITCDTCEPGLLLDTPAGAANCPGPSLNEVAVDTSGVSQHPAAGVILPVSPRIQQLSGGQTYHVNGWTIAVSGWVRFTNDATGHGMAVAAQNMDFF